MSEQPYSVFQLKEYMIIWRQEEARSFGGTETKIRGIVRCMGDNDYLLEVFFLTEDSPVPDPMIDLEKHKGAIFLSIRDIMAFVDTLRNESPLYAHLRGDRPEWTSVTTDREPIGVGDEDYTPPLLPEEE